MNDFSEPMDPTKRPPLKLNQLIRAMAEVGVRWVASGSVVLVAFGARFTPNDLDLVPATTPENLEKLAELLDTLKARPAYFPNWPGSPTLEQCQAWEPKHHTEDYLNRLFVTPYGPLDVNMRQCGTYDQLSTDAVAVPAFGTTVHLAAPLRIAQEVLNRGRSKDRPRRAELVGLVQQLHAGNASGAKGLAKALEDRYS
ncbi:MAG TPA: hypothetical protein VGO93_14660 [Candidatus Xenobia bacterium]|jgi:hypothetical protein